MILNMILLAAIYMIEPYIWLRSMSILGWKSERLKKYSWIVFLGYYILTIVKQYASLVDLCGDGWIRGLSILINAYLIVVPFVVFNGLVVKKIYNIGLFLICVYATEMLTFVIIVLAMHIPVSTFLEIGLINSACTLVSKLLLCSLCYLFFLHRGKSLIELLYHNRELMPLIIANVIFEVLVFNVFPYSKLIQARMETLVMFLFSQTVLVSTLFYIALVLRKVKAELEQKKEIIRLTNSLDNLRHDMSSHVRMIKSYVQDEKYKELKEYMNKTFSDIEVAHNTCSLDNYAVSVIISSFIVEAKKKKINFSRIISVKDFILSDNEICSVLSNVLKNAMEAAEKVKHDEPFICLEISPQGNGYYINCINSCECAPESEHGELQTTKKDKISHGRGINIIKRIVEKNNRGKVTTSFEDNVFEINCELNGKGR